jgi:branched-chain amino acid transport system substrate-binding protein
MELATREVNSSGGVKGRRLRVIVEDDQAIPQRGIAAFEKLTAIDRVPIVLGAMFSAVTLAIVPIATERHIVLLSPTSSAVELTHASPYFFRIYPSDAYDGEFLADFAINTLHARRAAVIAIRVASVAQIVNVFRAHYTQAGGSIVDEESYNQGDTDFRTQLLKIKAAGPEVLFMPGYLREMAIQLPQVREVGLEQPLLSISTFYDPKIMELAGTAAEGVMFSTPFFDPASPTSAVQHLVTLFKAQYRRDPDIWAAYGYDAVRIAASAIGQGGDTADGIRQALGAIRDFPGATGSTTFTAGGDAIKPLTILKVSGGRFVPY